MDFYYAKYSTILTKILFICPVYKHDICLNDMQLWSIHRKLDFYSLFLSCGTTGSLSLLNFLQERFYFSDHVLPLFETGIPLLKQRLHQLPDTDNVSILM